MFSATADARELPPDWFQPCYEVFVARISAPITSFQVLGRMRPGCNSACAMGIIHPCAHALQSSFLSSVVGLVSLIGTLDYM